PLPCRQVNVFAGSPRISNRRNQYLISKSKSIFNAVGNDIALLMHDQGSQDREIMTVLLPESRINIRHQPVPEFYELPVDGFVLSPEAPGFPLRGIPCRMRPHK